MTAVTSGFNLGNYFVLLGMRDCQFEIFTGSILTGNNIFADSLYWCEFKINLRVVGIIISKFNETNSRGS